MGSLPTFKPNGRTRTMVATFLLVVMALAGLTPITDAAADARTVVPTDSYANVSHGAPTGSVSGRTTVDLKIWLAPRMTAAERYATAVSTPGTRAFHRHLSPNAYRSRFGPTPAQAKKVMTWLRAGGMHHVKPNAGRDYVTASGQATKVQSLLAVRLQHVRAHGAIGQVQKFRTSDNAPSVPDSVATEVLAVTGLNTAPGSTTTSSAAESAQSCSTYWGQHIHAVKPAFRGLTTAVLPICGYSAKQLRGAYGATSRATGKGVTVALTESEAPTAMASTLRKYARRNHSPLPGKGQYRQTTAGNSDSCRNTPPRGTSALSQASYNDEAEMDSEATYAMAPDARQLMVVGKGCTEEDGLLNAVISVLDGNGVRPSATIVSNSWQIPDGVVPTATLHAIDVRAAVEGVGLYFAAGDTKGAPATASEPFVTAVGGTTLGIDAHDHRVFETGWSLRTGYADSGQWTDAGLGGAGGGGVNGSYRQPAYQKGVVPASMSRIKRRTRMTFGRAVPDISADGDMSTGMLTGYTSHDGKYVTMINAGTSLSTPLIAGIVADAQQHQKSAFGFINPLIYRMHKSRALLDVLPVSRRTPRAYRGVYTPARGGDPAEVSVFDDQIRKDTHQVTARGYDTMTGVGTPNGREFLYALRSYG